MLSIHNNRPCITRLNEYGGLFNETNMSSLDFCCFRRYLSLSVGGSHANGILHALDGYFWLCGRFGRSGKLSWLYQGTDRRFIEHCQLRRESNKGQSWGTESKGLRGTLVQTRASVPYRLSWLTCYLQCLLCYWCTSRVRLSFPYWASCYFARIRMFHKPSHSNYDIEMPRTKWFLS